MKRCRNFRRGRGGSVKIVAVIGTGSGCGKTTLACRILQEIPGLAAVKISPRQCESRVEWGAGTPGKDTDLYLRSGAAAVARIIGPRQAAGHLWDRIEDRFAGCRGVVVEGTGALCMPGEQFIIFVVGENRKAPRDQKNREIEGIADLVVDRSSHSGPGSAIIAVREFISRGR